MTKNPVCSTCGGYMLAGVPPVEPKWFCPVHPDAEPVPESTVEARLADVLRKHGVMPGTNPDGVNDDPEKVDMMLREAMEVANDMHSLAQEERKRADRYKASYLERQTAAVRAEAEVKRLTAMIRGVQAERDRLTITVQGMTEAAQR